jgi:HEAT repeat protein
MQRRISAIVLLAAAVAAGAALVTWFRASTPVAIPVAEAAVPTPMPYDSSAASSQVIDVAPASSTPTAEAVSQWIADTTSGDAAKRATAIAALAEAPKVQAVPVLRRLLTDAEPQVDRPLALRSLRDLALNQGDVDGTIRDAVRNAIYHGDDQTKMNDVQEVLDIIEESEQR